MSSEVALCQSFSTNFTDFSVPGMVAMEGQ